MGNNRLRRAVAVGCSAAFLVAGAAACSSDSSDDDAAASSSAAAASSSAAQAAATEEITTAYVTFFNGKTPPADRAALVENTEGFAPVLQGMAQDPQASATTVNVDSVTLTDPTHADVQYDLLLNGQPVMPDQTGQAVVVDGTWRVASDTFCALMSVQGGGAQVPACS